MLDNIIGFSIRHKLIITVGVLCLIGWGITSLNKLPIDAVPDITNNQVQVITQSPNLASQEIERLITYPIEVSTANIPGLIETRSISRFGLSVVTLVFDDDEDVYWARTQVSERLKTAENLIPKGVGVPELAPVSTGLSEIYQYVIHSRNHQSAERSLYELRTIQDWTLKRELLRVPGVADVSSFGGYLKQYHVRINPQLLQSTHVTLSEVFTALEQSNSNTGASYIEKQDQAYFIRGLGMAETMDDIANSVIKNNNGIPVLIRDIGTVELSHAVRYGALTEDGKDEVVGGIILMLKGENSSKVIDRVKDKMAELQKTLPPDLVIEPFLDREVLVKKAIRTVSQNLVEGGLIVIFVLILLLGNIRAGIIVASVIPLAMLFAIGMMQLFGVSGNLMSLGAIDFGLIVDGAVIIVEIVVRKLSDHIKLHGPFDNRKTFELTVQKGASEIMHSAAFGQLIILIVYIPILALTGIEGKMFRPMALTVSFAIIGAFLLSLTYVPMASAWFLKSNQVEKENFAERLIHFLREKYLPLVKSFIARPKWVVGISLALLTGALLLFTTLGGEFIPQLDEGDYAIETRLIPGTSLSQSIRVSKIVERRLMEAFPDEIRTTVAKIGTSEIPTDPMPIEAMDLMVILNERSKWKKVHSKEELDEAIEKELEDIPGVVFSLQQPIQMRFNELMTNAKTDVVIKLYGRNLDMLSAKAEEIASKISPVEGVKDVQAQKITGLPQIQITYNRNQLATYGISVGTVNEYIETAIAGKKAGVIYENEQGFDLVVKMADEHRRNEDDFSNLLVTGMSGMQVPLKELAEINVVKGPAEITRDDTKRKVSIGFNVRGRDVESVVADIKKVIAHEVQLPLGYYLHYGGQFENLMHARQRLMVVVPLALLIIFLLLYFTFGSLKQALLIFTAIPLATIGGVLSLWLRDMPFSISAGVGFIALFGIAVLNGIVLIAHLNKLEKEGLSNTYERTLAGVSDRFRPVLMTALVASLGFLPMALSHGAGAEVQKPLATVVIGGLISSTILTLLVLPVLYILFNKRISTGTVSKPALAFIALLCLVTPRQTQAQEITPPVLQQAIDSALARHPSMQMAEKEIRQQQALLKGSFSPGPLDLLFQSPTGTEMRAGVLQSFEFPLVYARQHSAGKQAVQLARQQKEISAASVKKDVRETFISLNYAALLYASLHKTDSLFSSLAAAAQLSKKLGNISGIELLNIETEKARVQQQLVSAEAELQLMREQMLLLTGININTAGNLTNIIKLNAPPVEDNTGGPFIAYYQAQQQLRGKQLSTEKWRMAPGFTFGYLNQAAPNTPFDMRLQYGLRIPIFFRGQLANIRSAHLELEKAGHAVSLAKLNWNSSRNEAAARLRQAQQQIRFYEDHALKQARELLAAATLSYRNGEVGLFQYLFSIRNATQTEQDYLLILKQYNLGITQLLYLKGE